MDYFWSNYQYLCAKKGVSVYEAARQCGVKSSASVSYWKNGSRPKAENLNKMLDYFDVDPHELFHVDLTCKDKYAADAAKFSNDPLYNQILKLTPQQRSVVQGFIAGLMANTDNSL